MPMSKSEVIAKAIEALAKHWGGFEFADFNKRDPWRILVSGIISHRTQDPVTYSATERLFSKWPDLVSLSKANPEVVAKTIFPAGFYNTKGKRLVEIANLLKRDYEGVVPDDIERLLCIKGVGRKTANLILSLGYGVPAIVVDTHVHRIANRTGWVKTREPNQTETELVKIVPKKYWIIMNELLVRLGQNVCKPLGPKCEQCPINAYCVTGKERPKSDS